MQEIQRCIYRQWFTLAMALLLVSAMGLNGCGLRRVLVKNNRAFQEKEELMAGFNQYWSLVAGKEVKKTFTREAPYVQEMISEESYALYLKLLYKSELQGVEVLGVTCEQPNVCCVDCRLTFLSNGKTVSRSLRDCWVRVQKKWYHVFKNPLIYPQLGDAHADEQRLSAAG